MRTCIVALIGAVAFVSSAHAATVAAAPSDLSRRGVLLGSSASIERGMDARAARRVFRVLSSDIVMGARPGSVSPDELQILLGRDQAAVTADQNAAKNTDGEVELTGTEVEVRAPRGVPEAPVQTPIPMGLAAFGWAAHHPASAWRLLLPVLN